MKTVNMRIACTRSERESWG